MAASDRFAISVNGTGGHGAMPHLARDPVVAAAAVVSALQPLVSRETSPTDGAVVTVSRFNTGPTQVFAGRLGAASVRHQPRPAERHSPLPGLQQTLRSLEGC